MAEVWEGRDEVLDRKIAIKTLHPHLARDPGFVTRFDREAKSAAKLNHPSIVAVFDTGVDPPAPGSGDAPRAYIIMELVTGGSLRGLLANDVPLHAAVDIAAQTAEGLHYAHSQGVVHRDIKPANILIQQDGRVKVTDFGIAKAVQTDANTEDLTQAGAILGTAKYLSPEQVDGVSVDGRSDIYSLGVVLYEMVCGRPPFVGSTDLATALMHVQATAPRPRQVRPGIPRPLDDVIVTAMHREPAGRFPSAAAMAKALRGIDLRADDAVPSVRRTPHDITPPAGIDRTRISTPADATTVQARRPIVTDETSTATVTRPGQPARTSRRSRVPVLATLALVGLIGGSAAGYAFSRPAHVIIGRPAETSGAIALDPWANDGENDDLAPLTIDGSVRGWKTEDYSGFSTDLPQGKPGIGLRVDLATAQRVRQVVIASPTRNWDAEIYVVDANATIEPRTWGRAMGRVSSVDRATSVIDVTVRDGVAVIVWITRVGPERQVVLSEVSVRT
jgi:eukaryotic-like serine/threonine-protein kinase